MCRRRAVGGIAGPPRAPIIRRLVAGVFELGLAVVGLDLGILLLVLPGNPVCSPRLVFQEPDVIVCSHASTVAAADPRRDTIYRGETAHSPPMWVLRRVSVAEPPPRHHQDSMITALSGGRSRH